MTRRETAFALAAITAGALLTMAWTACGDDRSKLMSAHTAPRPDNATGPTTAEVLAGLPTTRENLPINLDPIPDLGVAVEKKLIGTEELWHVYDNGLAYQIIKPSTGKIPQIGQMVAVQYVGTIPGSNQVFDQSTPNNPLTFQLGTKGIISGWNIAISTMHVGEKARFHIPSQFAYGERGSLPKIMPNQALNFELTLVSIFGDPVVMPKPATQPTSRTTLPSTNPATAPH